MGNRFGTLWTFALAPVAVMSIIFLVGGCGGSKERKVNVAAGEYYSEDEFERLSDGMKNSYCENLGTVRANAKQEFETKTRELAETNEKIKTVSAKRTELDRERARFEMEIKNTNDQITAVKALPDSVKIRIGESLETIAALPEVYNDAGKWWRLLDANKKTILDPYYCLADTMIFIPRDWPAN
jgi:hypothetical protein